MGNNMVPDKRPPISSSFVSGLPVSCTNRREQAHRRLELGDLLVIDTDSTPLYLLVSWPHQFWPFCWLLILIQLLCICWLAVLIKLGHFASY